MSRKHKLLKTSKSNIYEVQSVTQRKEYIVRFSYLGKNYGERNFTKIFGTTTLKQTFEMFQNVKVELSKGNNPFKKKKSITIDTYFEDYIKTIESQENQYNKTMYYNKHIKPIIGNLDVVYIETRHINSILNGTLKNLSARSKKELKTILNPIFKKTVKEGLIKYSPLEDMTFKKDAGKEELSHRLGEPYKNVVQKLYKGILKIERIEDKTVLLIALMTGRRRGEILKLRYSDIKNDKVFVPKHITKTNQSDEFPLPDEVIQLINTLPQDKENIFTIGRHRPTYIFNKLVKEVKIELTKGHKLTLHDTRHLFQSIMIPEINNPPLVDRCLSHTSNSIMNVYLSFTYEKRKEVFEKYWNIIRN